MAPTRQQPRRSAAAASLAATATPPVSTRSELPRGVKRARQEDELDEDVGVSTSASEKKGGGVRASATPQPGQIPIAEQLSFLNFPLPFKNPHFTLYKPRLSNTNSSLPGLTKTKKTGKQVLAMERERGGDGLGFSSKEAGSGTGKKKNGMPLTGAATLNVGGGNKKGKKKGKKEVAEEAAEVEMKTEVKDGEANDELEEEEDNDVEMEESGRNTTKATTPIDQPDEQKVVVPDAPKKREVITYLSIEAPPSLLPAKKYCDITGLPAKYTDPKTKLRYCGLEVWEIIRGLNSGQDQNYLALRNAEHKLK